jgi:hypothetical protein
VAQQVNSIIPVERIQKCILYIRGEKVMLDRDLAQLYGVETRVLNQAVKRNIDRFPEDFMFKLDKAEVEKVITNCDNLKDLKFLPSTPHAFTEQGVAMLSSVLRSKQAVAVNIAIMRTFVQLRRILADNALLRKKILWHGHPAREWELGINITQKERSWPRWPCHKFQQVFAVLKAMIAEDEKPKSPIGYHSEIKGRKKKSAKTMRKGHVTINL